MQQRKKVISCDEEHVDAAHKELHHYTGWGGLEGIWQSNTLFATRYDQLNDTTEIAHFRPILVNALEIEIASILATMRQGNGRLDNTIRANGGSTTIARNAAPRIVEQLYQSTFSVDDVTRGFALPFITSFCSHTGDDVYEKDNGLLSQWRGYNANSSERYGIVFDTKQLLLALELEQEKHDYPLISTADVVYNKDGFSCKQRFPTLLSACADRTKHEILEQEVPHEVTEQLFATFVTSASRFKHRGFQEEREVRTVSCVQRPQSIERIYRKAGLEIPDLKYKGTFDHKGRETIRLFEGFENFKLPIRRVIVGPSQFQDEHVRKVQELTSGAVEIIKSETPYIG